MYTRKVKYIPQSLCAQSSSTSNEEVENIPCSTETSNRAEKDLFQ